jgi:hypothetical protein
MPCVNRSAIAFPIFVDQGKTQKGGTARNGLRPPFSYLSAAVARTNSYSALSRSRISLPGLK